MTEWNNSDSSPSRQRKQGSRGGGPPVGDPDARRGQGAEAVVSVGGEEGGLLTDGGGAILSGDDPLCQSVGRVAGTSRGQEIPECALEPTLLRWQSRAAAGPCGRRDGHNWARGPRRGRQGLTRRRPPLIVPRSPREPHRCGRSPGGRVLAPSHGGTHQWYRAGGPWHGAA